MKTRKISIICSAVAVLTVIALASCKKSTGFNLFTLEQDIEFGEQMDSVIRSDPEEFPILSQTSYPHAYEFVNDMMNEILTSDDFFHKDDFDWQITIIDKDIMNAFAVPGGKLYFYTGLMKYLENAASLAGVLAHEMAHVDQRHSTQQITKAYEFEVLLSIITGNNKSQLGQIAVDMATGLASLRFSRKDEYEADEYAVRFTADTDYDPRGISGFFIQLKDDGKTQDNFEFLSTHPSDDNRIENINLIWESLGSPEGQLFETEYSTFKNSLP